MRRLIPLFAATLLVLACQDQVGPPDGSLPERTTWDMQDADNGGTNPHARWLEPVAKAVRVLNFGTFDAGVTSARLHVVCFETDNGNVVDGGHGCSEDEGAPADHWKDPANAIDSYQVQDGTLRIQDDHYHAQVELAHLSKSTTSTYTIYRLVVTIQPGVGFDPVVVAFADFRALENGRAKSALNSDEIGLVGSKLPAMFRLDQGVVASAIEDAITENPAGVPEGLQAFGGGAFKVTVVRDGEETLATFEEEDRTTAAFLFGPDVLHDGDVIAFAVGKAENGEGDDVCGDAFSFEKSGCKRAVAVSLLDPQPPLSDLTSGYEFQGDVPFCIATDIPENRQDLPWSLVKIDDYGQGPVFEVLQQQTGGVCDELDDAAPESPQLTAAPGAWLRHKVGRPILDFLVPPLYATHPADRMGASLKDLSDLTAALLTEIEVSDAPSGDIRAGAQVPVTFHVAYLEVVDEQEQELHGAADAEGVSVTFSISGNGGSLADPADQDPSAATQLTLPTGPDGTVTVLWTVGTDATTLTAAAQGAAESAEVELNGIGIALFGALTDPSGDAGTGGDFATASASVQGTDLTLTVTFHGGFDSQNTRVSWSLDLDQDINTGFPGVNAGNGDSDLMGTDYQVRISGSAFGSAVTITRFTSGTGGTTTTTSLVPTTTTDGYQVVVPLSELGWDDGFFNFKVSNQTQLSSSTASGIHDYISDLTVAPGSTLPVSIVH